MSKKAIYVTKSFMPPLEEYTKKLQEIWQSNVLTNQGKCLKDLENELENFLDVKNLHFLANGTLALQLALSSLGIDDGEIITTPFSYVATSSSILWQRCKPIYVDIEKDNFTLDPNKIEEKITKNTKAILAVHVFGYACKVEEIQKIAKKHNIKVIYDGSHAFNVKYKGKSLFNYGDISTLSFHATKLFHTVEGGACIVKDKKVSNILELQKRFGHNVDDHKMLGINAKASELHAAMGLVNLHYLLEIIEKRKVVSSIYDKELANYIARPKRQENIEYNYAYYPVLFNSEKELLKVVKALLVEDIHPRRYFYPSLNNLKYLQEYTSCPISEDITSRILCLPLYPDLEEENILRICNIIKNNCI